MSNFVRCRYGFTLVELSALIVVVAMAMSTILVVSQGGSERKAQANAVDRRTEIIAAIKHYLDRNGRYPCVAGYTDAPSTETYGREIMADCTADTTTPLGTARIETSTGSGIFVRIGAVPTFDLLLPDRYIDDGFGNRYTYMVVEGLTNSTTYTATMGGITVLDGTGANITTEAAIAVISHGRDGKGAFRVESGALKTDCGTSTNLDVENCDGDSVVRLAEFDATTDTASLFNDDFLQFELKGVPGQASEVSPPPPPPPQGPAYPGFRIDGAAGNQLVSIAGGDVNGDGFDDFIVNGFQAYIIFGNSTGLTNQIISQLITSPNVTIPTSATVAGAGDINGDKIDDIFFYNTDSVFAVFGKEEWPSTTADLTSLSNGQDGFRVSGRAGSTYMQGFGTSIAVGDLNNDGTGDLIIGSYTSDNNNLSGSGSVYVVFGKASGWTSRLYPEDLNGIDGFRYDAANANSFLGRSVASGDINNDGIDDLIVGCTQCNGAGTNATGATHVLFGKSSLWDPTAAESLLDGNQGFRINATNTADAIGENVESGDINGDGIDDVVISDDITSKSYVLFGKTSAWSNTTLTSALNGTNGFRFDASGYYVGRGLSVGDMNGDGIDDFAISTNDGGSWFGIVYVVFGKSNPWAPSFSISYLDGATGFRIWSDNSMDGMGFDVKFIDFDGNGFQDLFIEAWFTDFNGNADSGSIYGIYGSEGTWQSFYYPSDLTSQ